ncbi:hypothetical protein [Tsuneonella amylolytica]|uniref:hypothetical protein n=1 Tax=Tsuneonella amylolytica TaxID=2338327 RepID=UPI0013C4464C|nr:hypothetical protein [Tsuneonella amylolytica]
MRILTAAAAVLSLSATAAAAYDPIVLERGWWRVAAFKGGDCTGEVGTNGKYTVISARGLVPGERAVLTISNGDMKPIVRAVRADAYGRWQDYYIPFRYNREGGLVTATVAGSSCAVPLAFAWTPATGWEEPAPLQPR